MDASFCRTRTYIERMRERKMDFFLLEWVWEPLMSELELLYEMRKANGNMTERVRGYDWWTVIEFVINNMGDKNEICH